MTTIISGIFDTFPKAQAAVRDLHGNGLDDDDIEIFHNNAPGQHAAFPIGGDEDEDPQSRGAARDALKGAAPRDWGSSTSSPPIGKAACCPGALL